MCSLFNFLSLPWVWFSIYKEICENFCLLTIILRFYPRLLTTLIYQTNKFFTQVLKNDPRIWNQHPSFVLCANFQKNRSTLKIWAKFGLKSPFCPNFEKWHPDLKSASFNCAKCKFSEKSAHSQNWAKFGLKSPFLPEFWKMTPGFEISTLQLCYVQIFRKIGASNLVPRAFFRVF